MKAKTPKLRRVPVDTGYLAVRGVEELQSDAEEMAQLFKARYPGWGVFGLSAYHAADRAAIDALCGDQLKAWPVIAVFRVEDVVAAGLEVHRPHHTEENPYHGLKK
ncbi:MAG: hypothetical protein Q8P61_04990 [Candidatus Nanopelagicales bacterium]|nr:hypothetical protein [Candidatus Nanopelagicales bacterium]